MNDNTHMIIRNKVLPGEGVLHRYTDENGIEMSAIFIGSTEMYTQTRDKEESMIRAWTQKCTLFDQP